MGEDDGARANSIDQAIGRQLRVLRQARSITLNELALRIGVSHQQVQKYEAGTNRIGAGRLFELALALDVPVSAFFENLARAKVDEHGEPSVPVDARGHVVADRFGRLPEDQKRVVLSLLEAMSEDDSKQSGSADGA